MDFLSNELYHHGIKGQKWGIRRFQNADGSLTDEGRKRYRYEMAGTRFKKGIYKKYTGADIPRKNFKRRWTDRINDEDLIIDKDERIRHITPDAEFDTHDKRNNKRLYVYTDVDEAIYKGIYAALQRTRDRTVYEVDLDLKKNMRVAGKNTQYDEFKKLTNEYGAKKIRSELKPLCEKFNLPIPNSESELFVEFMELGPYIETGDSFRQFSKSIGKRYDAIVDLNDKDYNGIHATKPLIVLDILSSVGNVKMTELSDADIMGALKVFENQNDHARSKEESK